MPSRLASKALCSLLLSPLLSVGIAHASPWEVGSTSPSSEYGIRSQFALKHSASKNSWTHPELKFDAPLTPDLSYALSWGYGSQTATAQPSQDGSIDATAKLKWRLAHHQQLRPDVLIEPKLGINTGNRNDSIGSHAPSLKLPVRIGYPAGAFYWTAEVRYTRTFTHRTDDLIGYGVLAEYKLSPTLKVGIDLFNDQPTDNSSAQHWRSNAGFKQRISRHWQWRGLIGRSIDNQRGELTTSTKLDIGYVF